MNTLDEIGRLDAANEMDEVELRETVQWLRKRTARAEFGEGLSRKFGGVCALEVGDTNIVED